MNLTTLRLLATAFLAGCAAQAADPVFVTSDRNGGWADGGYYVHNNLWNSAKYSPCTSTLYASSYHNWYVVARMNNQTGDGAVKTYPNVHKDYKSVPIGSFEAITSTFAETSPHVGIYNVTYDIWINGIATPDCTEIMIWTENVKQTPGGRYVDEMTSDGRTYKVYKRSGSGYIAFVATDNFTSGTVDLLEIINWAMAKGWFSSKSTLNQICFGFETVSTDDVEAKFQVGAFSIDAKSKPTSDLTAPASHATNSAPVSPAPARSPTATALRVASVTAAPDQPQATDKALIFYEDFDRLPDWGTRFFEYVPEKESFVWTPDAGLHGGAMRCRFEKGQVSAGSLKVLFGRNPFGRGVRPNETFRDIYWRVYVKHESGWEGNPAKLARATCLAGRDWSQGLIAHVWGGKGDALCIDPATGIRDSRKVTTQYNDFANLKWLGSRQGATPIFSPSESGRWVCVESHVKLNTPGERDGVFELWIDGRLDAIRTDLDWQGSWSDYAINAVFLENYWNQGSVKRQTRWFDNFVISSQPIGPITASKPPTILRTGSANALAWEVEVATDTEGNDPVWKSNPVAGTSARVTVDAAHGAFTGRLAGKQTLDAGPTYWVRVRETGQTDWSPWHMPFR